MTDLIGQNLGPYRILEQVGKGGMATVYKAYQPSMNRNVAIKVLPAYFMQDPSFIERFKREAHTIARLEHPHILPVYDYGQADSGPTYIAMRYIDAGTLSDVLQQEPLPLAETTRYFEQIADALAYAHEKGVIHRDMKPSNVLVDERGQTFLTDFGLARMVEGSSELTGSQIVGTPSYLAPEVGEGRPADERSDIYALGIILYQMTTGQLPFDAETPMAIIFKHIHEPLPLPRAVNPNISEPVERVILKALAKNPDDRYHTVTAMQKALQKAATEESATVIAPAEDTQRSIEKSKPTPTKSRRWLWPVTGLIIVLLVIGALVLFWGRWQAGPGSTPPADSSASATNAPGDGAALSTTAGWTHFSNTKDIRDIVLQDDLVWTGGYGGLVAWNRHDGSYKKFTTLNGLPYHSIEALYVTQDGTLWAGTEMAGILRFDGQTWSNFDEDNGLPTNSVYAFIETDDGDFLAGNHYTNQAINQFDIDNWQTADWIAPDIPPIPLDYVQPVAFLEDDNGLWIGLASDNGLLYFDGSAWHNFTTDDGLPSNYINDLAFDRDKNLWVATNEQGGTGMFDGETFTPVPKLAEVYVTTLYSAPDGVLWLGTTDGEGLWRFDGQTLTPITTDDGLPHGTITAIVQDEDGILWLGVNRVGLVRFDGQNFETWVINNEPPFNLVGPMVETEDDRLWFVHYWGDLNVGIFDPNDNSWTGLRLSDSDIDTMALGPDGSQWFGTSWGVWRVDPAGDRQHFTHEDGLPDAPITSLAFDGDDTLWVGTEEGLVYQPAGESAWYDFSEHLSNPYVEILYTDPEGDIWIGTQQGDETHPAELIWVQDQQPQATWSANNPFPADDLSEIKAIAMDAQGHVWVGTWGNNTWRLEEKSASGEWRRFDSNDGAPSGEIISIAAAPDGSVWFGTWFSGLWKFSPNETWQHFTPQVGLPGWAVSGIYIDSNGILWLGTEGGTARYLSE